MMMLILPALVIEVLQGGVGQECKTMSAKKMAPIPSVTRTSGDVDLGCTPTPTFKN